MSSKYNIDSSHSEGHSMNVLHFADENYFSQLYFNPYLEKQKNVIYCAAILHDMCDKKYIDEEKGMKEIEYFLEDKITPEELFYTKKIIETISYSTVKKNGYPDLGEYQLAYNIVREADLLTSYDFDRTMIYNLNRGNSLISSYTNSLKLFEDRVFNYNKDNLFITEFAKQKSYTLTVNALKQMASWDRILLNTRKL
uniref:HD domain-containing protein n=1 Tax=viral metagenome TaxID=1070528 RepID=A0A6C0KMG1_9ZZZZ